MHGSKAATSIIALTCARKGEGGYSNNTRGAGPASWKGGLFGGEVGVAEGILVKKGREAQKRRGKGTKEKVNFQKNEGGMPARIRN